MIDTKPLPSCIELEKVVIASLVAHPGQIDTVRATLQPEDFYSSTNQEVYCTLLEMQENGVCIDMITLAESLKSRNKYPDPELIAGEYTDCDFSTHLESHIEIIRKKADLRKIIISASHIMNLGYDAEINPVDILSDLNLLAEEIEERSVVTNDSTPRHGRIISANCEIDKMVDFYKTGLKHRGVSTGWTGVTSHYKPAKGTMNIVTGIPGHGKSEFVDALTANISTEHNWKWSFFSPENYPRELHYQKLVEKHTGKPMLYGNYRMTEVELCRAMAWVDEHYTWIDLHEDNSTLDALLGLVRGTGIDGLVIDPWNELEMRLRAGESETDFICRQLTRLRRFARKQNIAVFVISHPAKMQKNRETGKYDVPTPYSISGSAHWYNKADNCLAVYRDMETNRVQLHIQKVKFKIHGKPGAVELDYDAVTGRYTEISSW